MSKDYSSYSSNKHVALNAPLIVIARINNLNKV